mmetsp:Transcript_13912/g.30718  ORF Transcript_13912/g.30718 Transcript_13912/m.30718 type:complete len:230 (+) Transcript_13912:402-1091(+)
MGTFRSLRSPRLRPPERLRPWPDGSCLHLRHIKRRVQAWCIRSLSQGRRCAGPDRTAKKLLPPHSGVARSTSIPAGCHRPHHRHRPLGGRHPHGVCLRNSEDGLSGDRVPIGHDQGCPGHPPRASKVLPRPREARPAARPEPHPRRHTTPLLPRESNDPCDGVLGQFAHKVLGRERHILRAPAWVLGRRLHPDSDEADLASPARGAALSGTGGCPGAARHPQNRHQTLS